jgi:hypothetical protein
VPLILISDTVSKGVLRHRNKYILLTFFRVRRIFVAEMRRILRCRTSKACNRIDHRTFSSSMLERSCISLHSKLYRAGFSFNNFCLASSRVRRILHLSCVELQDIAEVEHVTQYTTEPPLPSFLPRSTHSAPKKRRNLYPNTHASHP